MMAEPDIVYHLREAECHLEIFDVLDSSRVMRSILKASELCGDMNFSRLSWLQTELNIQSH